MMMSAAAAAMIGKFNAFSSLGGSSCSRVAIDFCDDVVGVGATIADA